MSDLEKAKARKKTTTTTTKKKTTKLVSATAGTALAGVAISQARKGKWWIVGLIIALILGAVGGYFGYTYICKDDCFVMNSYSTSSEVVDINIGAEEAYQTYQEIGAKCVVFGKDMSDKVKIEYQYREDISHDATKVDAVDLDKAGIYYAIYTIDHIRFKSVTLIRNIIVMREE